MNMSLNELGKRVALNLEGLKDEVYGCGFNDGYESVVDDVRNWGSIY